jgi:hypothetical protein
MYAIDVHTPVAYIGGMHEPGHTVAETEGFLADCKEEGVSDDQRAAIVDSVAREPRAGDLVKGSGGVFKRRFAGRGKGKSGGWRVMVAFVGTELPAYLLALLGKGTRDDFDASEVTEMRKMVAELKKGKSVRK